MPNQIVEGGTDLPLEVGKNEGETANVGQSPAMVGSVESLEVGLQDFPVAIVGIGWRLSSPGHLEFGGESNEQSR